MQSNSSVSGLAHGAFDLELPNGRRGDDHLVGRIRDRCPGGPVQGRLITQPPEQRIGVEQQDHRSKSRAIPAFGPSKSGAIVICSRHRPGMRGWVVRRNGTSRATGRPARAITISSPASTRSISRERWVLASWMLTVSAMTRPYRVSPEPHRPLLLVAGPKNERQTTPPSHSDRTAPPLGAAEGRSSWIAISSRRHGAVTGRPMPT